MVFTVASLSGLPRAIGGPSSPRFMASLSFVVAMVALSAFFGAMNNGFAFDDGAFFLEKTPLGRGLTMEGVRWAFTSTFAGLWFPVALLSHMLDVQLFGLSPLGHHLTSVIFHAANAVLLFLWLGRTTGATWRSFFVAVLFAVHPLHVESVAWLSARNDLLSAFFGLLALMAYTEYSRRLRPGWYLLAAACFALGLLSKPMLMTLPLLLLLLDWWPLGRLTAGSGPVRPRIALSRLLLEKMPLILLSAAAALAAFLAKGAWGALPSGRYFALSARLANAFMAYVAYLAKAFWPANLAAFYPHPGPSLLLWKWMAASLALLAGTVLLVALRRARPALLAGWLWYLGTLLPVIGIVQQGNQAMADRYTYLPLTGIFVMVSWGVGGLGGTARRSPVLRHLAIGAAVAVIFMATTRLQVPVWKNDISLFSHAARVVPDNWLAEYNLAVALQNAGRVEDAIPHYLETLRVNYYHFGAHANLGKILDRRGSLRAAIERYRFALMIDPGNADIKQALSRALARSGQGNEPLGR